MERKDPLEDSQDTTDFEEAFWVEWETEKKKKTRLFRRVFYALAIVAVLFTLGAVGRQIFCELGVGSDKEDEPATCKKFGGLELWQYAAYIDLLIFGFWISMVIVRFILGILRRSSAFSYIILLLKPVLQVITVIVWLGILIATASPILSSDNAFVKWMTQTEYTLILILLLYGGKNVVIRFVQDTFFTDKELKAQMQAAARRVQYLQSLLYEPKVKEENENETSGALSRLKRLRRTVAESGDPMIKPNVSLTQDENALRQRAAEKATKILRIVDTQAKGAILPHDLTSFFENQEVCDKVFRLLDCDGDGCASAEDVGKCCLRVERAMQKAVVTLQDRRNTLTILEFLASFIVGLIMLIILLDYVGVDSVAFLIPLATLVMGIAFIFGDTIRSYVEALLILFMARPFSIGDIILIDDGEDELIVKTIKFLVTFCRTISGKGVYIPNTRLARATITNLRLSEEVGVKVDLMIDFNTPLDKLRALHKNLETYLLENKKGWNPKFMFLIESIEPGGGVEGLDLPGPGQIQLHIRGSIRSSWQEKGKWKAEKTQLLLFLQAQLAIHEIEFDSRPTALTVELTNLTTLDKLRTALEHERFSKERKLRERAAILAQLSAINDQINVVGEQDFYDQPTRNT